MKCKHLYFYLDHPRYGFMNIRLQTWFPYHIQIATNKREWLRRSLEKAGIDFVARRNKFVHVDDYARAQRLLDFAEGFHLTDGVRVRHWVDANSAKGYNELNVFRAEMTMNQPGLSNRDLRDTLRHKTGYNGVTEKQLSAKMSRQIRLLRDQGLLRKMPRRKRYIITQTGHEISVALAALLAASTKQLMEIAA